LYERNSQEVSVYKLGEGRCMSVIHRKYRYISLVKAVV
jgi:hypothetical protein